MELEDIQQFYFFLKKKEFIVMNQLELYRHCKTILRIKSIKIKLGYRLMKLVNLN